MLSSSIRRAVRTTSSTVPFPNVLLPTTANVAGVKSGLLLGEHNRRAQHQRRYSSSSKPPVPPNDGSRPIDTSSSSSQAPAKNGVSNKSAAQKREGGKNSNKEHGRKAPSKSRRAYSTFLNLPSVPSTQDMPMQDVHLASFFSFHRPISVSNSIPPTTNDDAFNAIFESKSMSKKGRTDVINTLASAVQSMEHAYHGQDDLRHAVTHASVSNADPRIIHLDDVSEEELHTSIAEFARRLTPFNPPAAPKPYNAEEIAAAEEGPVDVVAEENPNVRTYSTVLTIRETAYADGQRTFQTYVAPLVPEEQHGDIEAPSANETALDEPNRPNSSYIERTVNNTMYAISVRRQRKLKMKKHKFKKLLRKTRTLRRKLDKA
ncbi:hypothetical protein UA08_02252 [Talaromyces atroroseus]|uniref:Small ribosomal subunit protein mS38 n=1 Tax=Talaromyces atroroseus TaxID=1441469 RepID=A0A225AKF0_TALAT|nr:hypothetical protein UA08_02252 [Talaromyces atroroseus]OKL62031.1 hypothetical protein UA08_02252 [Talaromyces atroroseus]